MTGIRALCAAGCVVAHCTVSAAPVLDEATDRIAAHFETQSSRLRASDDVPLAQFVAMASMISGSKLAVLVPAVRDPLRARFIAARVAELERRVSMLAETAEFHKVPGNMGGDLLWLVIIRPPAPSAPAEKELPVDLTPRPTVKTEPFVRSVAPQSVTSLNAADLRLTDWVIRGVKHPAQGPTYAYVAKAGSNEAPREIVEQQSDRDLGLVRDITKSKGGSWVVHTEIGWIGQAFVGSPEEGGH